MNLLPAKLNRRQELYCRARAAGVSPIESYRLASPASSRSTAAQRSRAYERLERVRERIEALQAQVDEALVVTIEQIRADLTEIATDPARPDGVRLKAYDQLTRMVGGYAPEGAVTNVTVSLTDRAEALRDLLPPPSDGALLPSDAPQ